MKNKISLKIASASKNAPQIRAGGLDVTATIRVVPNNKARGERNIERQKLYNGLTVSEALEKRIVDSRDLKYDLSKNFITLETTTTKTTKTGRGKTTGQSRPTA